LISSVAYDTWSENAVVIFAVFIHFIDAVWKLNNRLAMCNGLDSIAHIGTNIIANLNGNGVNDLLMLGGYVSIHRSLGVRHVIFKDIICHFTAQFIA
jgi:hypothetical protein